MAMVGLGCRAPKSMFVQHAAFMRLLPYCAAARDTSSWSGRSSSHLALSPWRAGSRDNTFWQHLRLNLERSGIVELRNSASRHYVKAADVSDPGTIDSPLMQSMQKKIKDDLQAESVTVKDAYGDGRHVSIDVVASAFEGKSAVNRQRLVYKSIWEELQATVHAVDQLKTRTPSEAAKSSGQL